MIDDSVRSNECENSTSLSLLERIKSDNQAAWQRVRDLYAPLIYHWCRQAGVPAHQVADIGQEVFIAVARGIGGFRREKDGDTFRGWLRRITQRKVIDFHRYRSSREKAAGGSSAQGHLAQVPFDDAPTTDELGEDAEAILLYSQAVEIISNEFPAWYKPAFLGLVVEEKAADVVARELDVRVSAVYNAKARVLRRLREEFVQVID